MKLGRGLIPLLLFLALAVLLWVGLYHNPRHIDSPLIGRPVPQFNLTALHGRQPVSQQRLQGQVSLLNVWATWCISCQVEHANLMAIAKQAKVPLIGLDYKDKRDKAQQWLKQHGNPYVLSIFDPQGSLALDLGVYGVPETFLIDKQGIIRAKWLGVITESRWRQELWPQVKVLLGEKA